MNELKRNALAKLAEVVVHKLSHNELDGVSITIGHNDDLTVNSVFLKLSDDEAFGLSNIRFTAPVIDTNGGFITLDVLVPLAFAITDGGVVHSQESADKQNESPVGDSHITDTITTSDGLPYLRRWVPCEVNIDPDVTNGTIHIFDGRSLRHYEVRTYSVGADGKKIRYRTEKPLDDVAPVPVQPFQTPAWPYHWSAPQQQYQQYNGGFRPQFGGQYCYSAYAPQQAQAYPQYGVNNGTYYTGRVQQQANAPQHINFDGLLSQREIDAASKILNGGDINIFDVLAVTSLNDADLAWVVRHGDLCAEMNKSVIDRFNNSLKFTVKHLYPKSAKEKTNTLHPQASVEWIRLVATADWAHGNSVQLQMKLSIHIADR